MAAVAQEQRIAATEGQHRILLLYSHDRLLPVNVRFDEGFHAAWRKHSLHVEIYGEFLDAVRFPGIDRQNEMEEYLRRRFAGREPDLLVSVGSEAFRFLMTRRDKLFPGKPLLFSCMAYRPDASGELPPDVAGMPLGFDTKPLLEAMVRLEPPIRRIHVITGSSVLDERVLEASRPALNEFEQRGQLTWWLGLPLEELKGRLGRLEPGDGVLFLGYAAGPAGEVVPSSAAVLEELCKSSTAPVFCLFETQLDRGVAGGYVTNFHRDGAAVAGVARRILAGEPVRQIGVVDPLPQRFVFNAPVLDRHGIRLSSLPEGSEVRNLPPSLWTTHRGVVIGGGIVGLVQAALISGLLMASNRRKRLAREQAERLRFEQVLTEVSADLVEASVETLDEAISNALEKVRGMMGFQSCMLFEHPRDARAMRILYHTDPAVCDAVTRKAAELCMPWLCAQLQHRKAIPLADALRDLPAEAQEELAYVRSKNIKSALIIPLHSKDDTTHGISFCTGAAYREWSEPVVVQLQALGDVLSSSVSRHRAEMELRLSEERFSKAFHASPSAMVIFRAKDETIMDVNEAWERQFGFTYGEAAGRLPADLGIYRRDEDRLNLAALVDTAGSLRNHEVILRSRMEQEVFTNLSIETITIHEEACYIAMFHDITGQRRVEEMRQSMMHVSRLALVGELTASIAHEINQPLGAILSNAEAAEMLMDTEPPPLDDIRQILADIRKDDLRASQVIRHIRTLVRRAPLRLDPVQVNDIVEDVLKLLSTDARRRGLILQCDLSPDCPAVPADRVHVQQVLINLIVNAMDAMKGNGASHPMVEVRTFRTKPHSVSVSVRDHGHGISEDRLPQVFESFFTTKVEGMGLGLSIARSIIEAHGGSISASNEPDGGALFTFTLPGGNETVMEDVQTESTS